MDGTTDLLAGALLAEPIVITLLFAEKTSFISLIFYKRVVGGGGTEQTRGGMGGLLRTTQSSLFIFSKNSRLKLGCFSKSQ
jgi:hypothetical protein